MARLASSRPQALTRPRRRTVLHASLLIAGLLAFTGCSHKSLEERAREQAEKVIGAMGAEQARALDQKVTPEVVTQAQQALTQAHEYLGEVNGKLDAVTVNAIEAFQRSHGVKDDGMLNDKTQRLLREELAKK